MFDKILIANRGEIACRIMETAHKMGVKTVAIYSDADRNAKHVAMADEAYNIGPPAVSESYLNGDAIIDVALSSGAKAIHPGYGFLSENPNFVELVQAAGLRFIGPSADAIRAMGLKDAAKILMEKAGVPVVPGYHGNNQNVDYLAEKADGIGYPVLIKARAGGGGKGMRKVDTPDGFQNALKSAQAEAVSAFGDGHCLIEKWVNAPRHIEIQIFGDDYGNVVHMFERDCSLQRRHQKVIEEAPAPGMTDEMRAAMGDAAVRCAKSVSYSGAGTVEFIVDGSNGLDPDRFWFMEMNTRLQVEHPVTEAVTGIDLVEWQLRVAAAEPLPLEQGSLTLNGHAFEARVYAENVPDGFLPSTGTIERMSLSSNARIDSGVRQMDSITPWYDPMIAKITTHGATREIALHKLKAALNESYVCGITNNIEFLSSICSDPEFSTGAVDTDLISRNFEHLVKKNSTPQYIYAVAAVIALEGVSSNSLTGWHHWAPLSKYVMLLNCGQEMKYKVTQMGVNTFIVTSTNTDVEIDIAKIGDDRFQVFIDTMQTKITALKLSNQVMVYANNMAQYFDIITINGQSETDCVDGDAIFSPMPGVVKAVEVSIGATINSGDPLVIIEAMKMEHTLYAPRDGVIAEMMITEGQQVELGELVLSLVERDE